MRHETRDMRHTLLAALMTLCAVTVATAAPTGVTVNGVDLDYAGSGGEGWKYYLPHITLLTRARSRFRHQQDEHRCARRVQESDAT